MKNLCMIILILSSGYTSKTLNAETIKLNNHNVEITNIEKISYSQMKATLKAPLNLIIGNNSYSFKENSIIIYDKKYNYITNAYLAKDMRVHQKNASYILAENSPVEFLSSDGNLNTIYLYQANLKYGHIIYAGSQAIDCRAGGNPDNVLYGQYDIRFDQSGQVSAVVLASDQTFTIGQYTLRFMKDTKLLLDQGTIRGGNLSSNQTVDLNGSKIMIEGKKDVLPNIRFDKNGNITSADVTRGSIMRVGKYSVTFQKSNIDFYPDGQLKRAEWLMPLTTIIGKTKITLGGRKHIDFYQTGNIKSFNNDSKQEVAITVGGQQIILHWNKRVILNPDESVKDCYLGKDSELVVNGIKKQLKKGTHLYFDTSGKLVKVR